VAPLPSTDWHVVTVIPESDFTATIDASTERLAINLLILMALIGVCAIALSRRLIDRPLSALAAHIRHIEAFDLQSVEQVPSRISEVRDLSTAMTRMADALQGVGRFVPTNVVRSLVMHGASIEPQHRTATLLYLDIAKFTALGERLSPGALVDMLGDFLR
jgi:adenylate cyclase